MSRQSENLSFQTAICNCLSKAPHSLLSLHIPNVFSHFHHWHIFSGNLHSWCLSMRCSFVRSFVWAPPTQPFTLLFSGLPPPILPSLRAYVPLSPPGRGCSTSSAAAPAKNRCPRNTSLVRKRKMEGGWGVGSTWRQIRWTVGSAGAVWKCGIPFRDLKSCVAKLMVFVFRQYLGLFFSTYRVLINEILSVLLSISQNP